MSTFPLNYFPHPPFIVFILALALAGLMIVLRFVFVGSAFQRLGLGRRAAMLLLWASLLGSQINIPVARLPAAQVERNTLVSSYGILYVVPEVVEHQHTVVAVNVGGAVIPVLVSLYLMARFGLGLRMLLAIAIVSGVAHGLAHPVRGVGIAMPPFVAAAAAALAALLLERGTAPRTAFVAGTLGTLIGADLLNLSKLGLMNAPVVSIGGAGTFDGIFVTGIVAVLLAGFGGRGPRPEEEPS